MVDDSAADDDYVIGTQVTLARSDSEPRAKWGGRGAAPLAAIRGSDARALREWSVEHARLAGCAVSTVQRSLQRRVSVRVPSFLVAPIVVAGSDLILTLPERIARLMARGQRLRILPPPLELAPFTVQMVWRGSPDDAALAWLRGQLTQSAATIAIIGDPADSRRE